MHKVAKHTKLLNLFEIEPATDGNLMFDIQRMLNDNWDKLENALSLEQLAFCPGVSYTQSVRELSGNLDEWTTVFFHGGQKILEVIQTERTDGWTTQIKKFTESGTSVKTLVETTDEHNITRGQLDNAEWTDPILI